MIRRLLCWCALGTLCLTLMLPGRAAESLIKNRSLMAGHSKAKSPDDFEIVGDAQYGLLGDPQREIDGPGVRLLSGRDLNKDGQSAGAVWHTVSGIGANQGRWYRFSVRGLAQEDFRIERDELYLKVEFFRDGGTNSLDFIKKTVYAQVEQNREDLADPGTNRKLGAATWRWFSLEFRTPFPEVDALKLSAGFQHGAGKGDNSEFWINQFDLVPIPDPADYLPRNKSSHEKPPALDSLVKLGGRWYYDPRGKDRTPPEQFEHTNSERLYYLTDRLEAPFAGNMSSWLRKGWLDRAGKVVAEDRFVPDCVVIRFTPTHLVMRSKVLPNHPTAVFPDRWRALDGNPNYIQEHDDTYFIPLEPTESPRHVAMNEGNQNQALPMGPIGVAINGIPFFHPFDHINQADAVWRLDRCCGHPTPMQQYHYHKYPVCIKSPWTDDGASHSPLIGFAFDGFPVYGPYESAGVLAKDDKSNPLNEFNLHRDKHRGWHYHVTPGKFPHLIGGFWGEMDEQNRRRRGPPPGGPGGPGGPPPGGPGKKRPPPR